MFLHLKDKSGTEDDNQLGEENNLDDNENQRKARYGGDESKENEGDRTQTEHKKDDRENRKRSDDPSC